ncbi:MAG: hypothetical protein KDJ41_12595 [Hyphomicrobiaceae bacterium]|nr:hypothetical protein [Hyphomicrobiaceae bacterium]
MRSFNRFLAVAGVAALSLAVATVGAQAKCVKASGQGVGITKDIATTMATMAMGNSIKAWAKGKKAKVGKAKVACKLELGYSCRATARACKK